MTGGSIFGDLRPDFNQRSSDEGRSLTVEPPPFVLALSRRHKRRRTPFATSFLLHAAAILAIASLPQAPVRTAMPIAETRVLRIRLGDRIYLVSPIEELPVRSASKESYSSAALRTPSSLSIGELPKPSQPPALETAGKMTPKPTFQPPIPEPQITADPELLQPSARADRLQAEQAASLPSVLVWTREKQLRPPPKRFVAPGPRREMLASGEVQMYSGAPIELTEVQIPSQMLPRLRAQLASPPAKSPELHEGALMLPGDPIQLMARGPAELQSVLIVPEAASAAGLTGRPELRTIPGMSSKEGGQTGDRGNPGAAGLPGATPPGVHESIPANALTAASLLSRSDVMKIENPGSGSFDAVVVQSTVGESIPESKGLLRGRPIYTVYISTQSPKDWVLHYCDPLRIPPPPGAHVVRLDSVTPLAAPYPTLIVKPLKVLSNGGKYIVLHGTITRTGKMESLRVVRAGLPQADDLLLACLRNWQFRPATRDGQPVSVEILLSVPVDRI